MSKENVVEVPEIDKNAIIVYVSSGDFPAKQCLAVTKDNLLSLANLTAQEDFADLGGRLKEVQAQNASVMQSFMDMRIKGDDRYVVVFAGCEVMILLCSNNNLAKPMGSAVKSVVNVEADIHNRTLNIPWLEHTFVPEDTVWTFNTGHINVDDKSSVVTLNGESLKAMIQIAVQTKFDKLQRAMATMYGPVDSSADEVIGGH